MRAVRSFVRSVRAAATEHIQTAFTGLIAAEAAAERERTVWISRPHTRGQIIVLFSQITSVSSTSEYKIQNSCSFPGALKAAPTRKALIANSISNVTNNVRNIPCIQAALFIAPLLNHIRVAHLLSVWCIHGGESAWKNGRQIMVAMRDSGYNCCGTWANIIHCMLKIQNTYISGIISFPPKSVAMMQQPIISWREFDSRTYLPANQSH